MLCIGCLVMVVMMVSLLKWIVLGCRGVDYCKDKLYSVVGIESFMCKIMMVESSYGEYV